MFYISSLLSKFFINSKRSSSTLSDPSNCPSCFFFSQLHPSTCSHTFQTHQKWPMIAGHPRLSKVLQRPIEAEPNKGGKEGGCERAKMRAGLGPPKKNSPRKRLRCAKKILKTSWVYQLKPDDNRCWSYDGILLIQKKHRQKSEENEFVTKKRCFTVVYSFAFASKIIINATQHDVPWDALPFQYQ